MRLSSRWWVAVWLTVSSMTVASPRRANGDDVDTMVERGVEYRRKGRDGEALEAFQRAFRVRPAPRIQAQIALAEQALGLWVDAERDLLRALEPLDDDWIRKNRSRLNAALGVIQMHLGTLEIWGSPTGAEIFVNEKKVGTLPLATAVRVSGESAILRAAAPGFSDASRTVRVLAAEHVREHIELVPDIRTSRASHRDRLEPGGATRGAGLALSAEPPPTALGQDGVPTPSAVHLRPYAWAAGGLTVLTIGFGVVETFMALSKRTEFAEHLGPNPDSPAQTILDCGTAKPTSECRQIQDAYQRNLTRSIVAYGIGGALAIGTAVLFVLSSRDAHPASSESAFTCVPDPFSRGAACHLAF